MQSFLKKLVVRTRPLKNVKQVSHATEPRRILYVENGIGYGGAIICLRHLVRNLDRSRFVPMVVTGRTGPQYREIASEAPWKHIPDQRIDVVGIRRKLGMVTWVNRVPGLRFLLNKLIARIDDLGNFLPFFLQLLWVAVRFQPALIHVNNEPLCNRAAILAGKLLRVPVVCHVRGAQKGSPMTGWLYRLPDHFIPVSYWISKGISGLGIPEDKCTVVYDGISLEDLDLNADGSAFRKTYGVPEDAFAVGLVGLLVPWKGQHLFIDAAKKLTAEIQGLRMFIIGGTPEECAPYEQELKARVDNEGLNETVIFTGHINEMPLAYKGLDVVVSASTSPEPLGTVVIECMAMGRPLVAPNHGGAAEMCEHNKTTLLFKPGHASALKECIYRLYVEPSLRSRLGKAARKKASATFLVAEHVRRVQAVYEKCLKKI